MTTTTADIYSAEDILIRLCKEGSPMKFNGRVYQFSSIVLSTTTAVENFHQQVLNSLYTISRYGVLPPCTITVKKRLQARSYYSTSVSSISIAQQEWAMNKVVVLHEIAHHINHVKNPHCDSHGSEFFTIYLQLIRDHISADCADFLGDFVCT